MTDDFFQLFAFFERCGSEVEGRGLTILESEYAAKIERFVAGLCNQAECRELAQFLQRHPTWIRWVADRVKIARDDEGAQVV